MRVALPHVLTTALAWSHRSDLVEFFVVIGSKLTYLAQ
jgi:hypothetical protein